MKEFRLAGRYAKALFDLAIEMNVLEEVHADAELIIDVCEKNKEFVLMLRSPIIKDVKKLAILKDIFENNLNELTYRFIVLITRNKRESIIKEIAERF
ncbi:MAG: ATP synthase F1 subunit delta, partial [Bacteroidales bacterium]|nr:ATP synthase F1 subunit delta [Bacteroidales bacterium]